MKFLDLIISVYRCGTPGFVAPEILNNKKYEKNCICDIFSAGIILHQLLL